MTTTRDTIAEYYTTEERREIQRLYRKILRKARPLLKEGDSKEIKKAVHFAAQAHRNDRRKSGEPYIYHPLEVALICIEEIGLGTTSIVCALLHDVVEDTEYTLDDLEKEFGTKVRPIIDGLTKLEDEEFDKDEGSKQAQDLRKVIMSLVMDVRVVLIKLADRLHNMRTLGSMPEHKRVKKANETHYMYSPLAHRLGLYSIKSELEDLYLKHTNYEEYRFIADKLNTSKASRTRFINNFIKPIEEELNYAAIDYNIKGRPKSIHSIWKKMQKQEVPFEEVYDKFAIRIILNTPEHASPDLEKGLCWNVYSIVTDHYKPNPSRLRDWISTPKANGYESLHTTVMSKTGQWVEVQIRTRRMDEIAEKGYAAHWKYKENAKSKTSSLEQWINRVRDSLETDDLSAMEFVDEFRNNLFQREVFVFTPKGDLKILQEGATALDFAFEIHTQVGASCLSAKVNNKLQPITYTLQSGDQVEIITSKKQKPSEDWLRIVKTTKARNKIKDALREERREVELDGKDLVKRKLDQIKVPFNHDTVEQLRAFFNLKSVREMYYLVGTGTIAPADIKRFKDARSKVRPDQQANIKDGKSFEKVIKKAKGNAHDVLLIGEDEDVIDYTLARCCQPIAGDKVFGFVTVNEGIKIHRTDCPNATELLSHHGHRVVKASWASKKTTKKDYVVALHIEGTDRVGLIKDVTMVISTDLEVNMRSIDVSSNGGMFEGMITLYVQDTEHLERLVARIKAVHGIYQVTRTKFSEEEH